MRLRICGRPLWEALKDALLLLVNSCGTLTTMAVHRSATLDLVSEDGPSHQSSNSKVTLHCAELEFTKTSILDTHH